MLREGYVSNDTLINPPNCIMDPKACTIHQEAGRLLRDAACEPLTFLPILLRDYLVAGVPRTIRTLLYAFEDPMEEHLPQVTIPILVVCGARDPFKLRDPRSRGEIVTTGRVSRTQLGQGP